MPILALSFVSSSAQGAIYSSSLSSEQKVLILEQTNKLGGIEIPPTFGEEASVEAKGIIHESFVSGFRIVMGINVLLALSASFFSFIFPAPT